MWDWPIRLSQHCRQLTGCCDNEAGFLKNREAAGSVISLIESRQVSHF
jgi:hypothetical protein